MEQLRALDARVARQSSVPPILFAARDAIAALGLATAKRLEGESSAAIATVIPPCATRSDASAEVVDACRAAVQDNGIAEPVRAWGEWTLRWIEMRTRAGTKWREDVELERSALAFLIALWNRTRDLRFLNALLKLGDVMVARRAADPEHEATMLAVLAAREVALR